MVAHLYMLDVLVLTVRKSAPRGNVSVSDTSVRQSTKADFRIPECGLEQEPFSFGVFSIRLTPTGRQGTTEDVPHLPTNGEMLSSLSKGKEESQCLVLQKSCTFVSCIKTSHKRLKEVTIP